jgi:zinc-ribbon domain
MFCTECGNQTPDDSHFCRSCGHAVLDSSSIGAAAAVAPACVREKPKRKVLWILLPIGLLLVYWLSTHRTHAQPPQTVAKQQKIQTVSNSALLIKATGNSHFKLDVPPGADNVHLWGDFIARGGMDDDIEAWVFSDEEFMNWQNGQSAETLYNSGKITAGRFDIKLPSDNGTYYLVFDNTSSLFISALVYRN